MPSALGEFGQSKHSEAQSKVISALQQAANNTLVWEDLWKHVHRELNDVRELSQIINNLRSAKRLHINQDGSVTLSKEIPLNIEGVADFNKYIREYNKHVG